jgi:hypothetical protein
MCCECAVDIITLPCRAGPAQNVEGPRQAVVGVDVGRTRKELGRIELQEACAKWHTRQALQQTHLWEVQQASMLQAHTEAIAVAVGAVA